MVWGKKTQSPKQNHPHIFTWWLPTWTSKYKPLYTHVHDALMWSLRSTVRRDKLQLQSDPDLRLLNTNAFYFDQAHSRWRSRCRLLTRAQKAISQAISSRTYRRNANKSLPFSKEIPARPSAWAKQSDAAAEWHSHRMKAVQPRRGSWDIVVLTGFVWIECSVI